jgi:MFS family permease
MIYPIVPIFLTSVLGAPVAVVGLIEGVAEGLSSFLKFVFGYWSDKVGKRKIFVAAGYGSGALSKVLIGLANIWPLVLFARVIDRLGKGLRTSARDALLLQNAGPTNRGFIFGFHRAMDSLGAVFGPLLALLLLYFLHDNTRLIFFLAFFPAIVSVLLVIVLVKEKKEQKEATSPRLSFRLRWRGMHQSMALFFLVSIIFALGNSADTFLILRARDLGLTTTLSVLAYVVYNVSQTVFATPAGKLADKIGARKVYAVGLLVFAFVYFAFGWARSSVWLWGLFFVYGVYIAFTDGVSKAYLSEFFPQRESGTYFGLYQTCISIATFFASFLGGLLWTRFGPAMTFYYGSLMALAAFVVLVYGKFRRQL